MTIIERKSGKNPNYTYIPKILGVLGILTLKASIFAAQAMDPAPTTLSHTPVTTISHHFLVDIAKREIGFIKHEGKLYLPSCQVLDTELSNKAMKECTKNQTGINVSDMFFVGKIECSPEQNRKLFSFSDFLSLFGIVSSESAQVSNQNSTQKINHMYFLSPVLSQSGGMYWVSIPDIYKQYGTPGALSIEPKETVDILKLMTNFSQNKKFDLKTDIPSIAQHFAQNKIKVDVDIYFPISFQDKYFKGRSDLQTEKSKKQKNVDNTEALIVVPAGLVLAGMYATTACTIL